MNLSTGSIGPQRSKSNLSRGAAAPYNRANRTPKGDVNGQWSHDLYETHNSLSARLNLPPTAPKANLNPIAQKAIKDATSSTRSEALSIKGAGSQGNVVEVSGLVAGTTAEDVAAIFKRCGAITEQKSVSKKNEDVRIRLTFKTPASATSAVQKFHNQPADGKTLSVKIVGASSMGLTLGGRLGGSDGLGLVREEGSVDVLMDAEENTGSKMRSDSLIQSDPRAHVLVAPPGADPADYLPASSSSRWREGAEGVADAVVGEESVELLRVWI
ncbi:hypothetical protein NLJ89_g8867 [Agrocybe chaxingu]|uniref:RRM domain-containing protein n=1 Tax=Agrocybe chaxingu TaxID=84603 RepID=A0A9W8JRU5_9AGAR|nr:hypothetical protein NLJ89_g8867 [Agrocybe chaxingu]